MGNAAPVADVEVTGAGEIRVRRIVCAVDCGTIINPDIVKVQIKSGFDNCPFRRHSGNEPAAAFRL